MSTNNLHLRDLNKGYYAKVIRLPKDLEKQKTVTVCTVTREYMAKYKRFYKKTRKYHVHCDLKNPEFNPANVQKINLNDTVYCIFTRRISKTKNAVIYFKK